MNGPGKALTPECFFLSLSNFVTKVIFSFYTCFYLDSNENDFVKMGIQICFALFCLFYFG